MVILVLCNNNSGLFCRFYRRNSRLFMGFLEGDGVGQVKTVPALDGLLPKATLKP